jgi:hypothetical protein
MRYDKVTLFSAIAKGDYMNGAQKKALPLHFKTMVQADVPQGREGKHKRIVTTILRDLDRIKPGSALKVPLAELVLSKEKVRSALNRATRKEKRKVATASDATFLYVWNVGE